MLEVGGQRPHTRSQRHGRRPSPCGALLGMAGAHPPLAARTIAALGEEAGGDGLASRQVHLEQLVLAYVQQPAPGPRLDIGQTESAAVSVRATSSGWGAVRRQNLPSPGLRPGGLGSGAGRSRPKGAACLRPRRSCSSRAASRSSRCWMRRCSRSQFGHWPDAASEVERSGGGLLTPQVNHTLAPASGRFPAAPDLYAKQILEPKESCGLVAIWAAERVQQSGLVPGE